MSELTHFNQAGEAHMVDIADKDPNPSHRYRRGLDQHASGDFCPGGKGER